ncbi:rho GTPase-activating protein Graf isoform X2 [Rhipicephalus sanguineus]|uniref:rho GTPase-activating protein Graf isoform X2 n=1 Tax=Rhipicephalus sanguineus TaxID=34632 RepID=UPI0020C57346|nr:rho GTPase-activating protein Graf isoform X2 [Rhipicephalus sanguineus]
MGLLPLEFTDCLTDSPYFRENLHAHENELDRTSQAIKGIIKEVKDLLNAARNLSRAQRSLANSFINFRLECIGNSQTDDEIVIAGSLKEFGRLLMTIEDERDRMLENAHKTFIEPIERFRKDHIGEAKERKKKFDKETARYCQSLERYLGLSVKKGDAHQKEVFAVLEMEKIHFFKASLEYVLLLQKVQERKKTEFVETILRFMYGWLTFYHQGHEVAKEFNSFNTDLQVRLQKTRENFEATHNEAEHLMKKMLEVRTTPQDSGCLNKMYTRQGYLFLMEKRHITTIWNKHYCQYQKENRKFTMIPYSQTVGKITTTDTFCLKECIRRMNDSIDKRFCFDLTASDRPGLTYTFQALSEDDCKQWLNAMDGREPTTAPPGRAARQEGCLLDETGFAFVRDCIEAIEARGLEDQGLYRIVGVNSKVTKLTQMAFDPKRTENPDFMNSEEWEIKTITSALKNYFRNLPEPLMTFRLHTAFISAAKQENKAKRTAAIEELVSQLPPDNQRMAALLIRHLQKVSDYASSNLMTVSNLGVCFGPTLLRPEEETMAAIMDIKFCNVVVEILIENCDKIFKAFPKEEAKVATPASRSLDGGQAATPQEVVLRERPSAHHFSRAHGNDVPGFTSPLAEHQRVYPGRPYSSQPHVEVKRFASLAAATQAIRSSHMPAVPPHKAAVTPLNSSRSAPTGGYGPRDNSHNVNSNSSSTESLSSRSNASISHHSPVPATREYHSSRVLDASKSSQSSTPTHHYTGGRKVRTLYACVGENNSELSFEPNQIIDNVRPSRERGWLEGCLNGRCGLVPENYVEFLP